MSVNNTLSLPGLENLVKPFTFLAQPYEYKVQALRECPTPQGSIFPDLHE
jgi:hypothetical protein